jgi:hypothetical protein
MTRSLSILLAVVAVYAAWATGEMRWQRTRAEAAEAECLKLTARTAKCEEVAAVGILSLRSVLLEREIIR